MQRLRFFLQKFRPLEHTLGPRVPQNKQISEGFALINKEVRGMLEFCWAPKCPYRPRKKCNQLCCE